MENWSPMVEEVVLKTILATLKRVAVTEDDHGVV